MKVRELMLEHPRVASPGQSLAVAGKIMAEIEAGVLPVLGEGERLCGVLTDRDVCVALADRDVRPSEMTVSEAMTDEVHTCGEEDDLLQALAGMRQWRVRRLPVVTSGGHLAGLLCFDDIAAAAVERGDDGATPPTFADVAQTLKAISRHPVPGLRPSRPAR